MALFGSFSFFGDFSRNAWIFRRVSSSNLEATYQYLVSRSVTLWMKKLASHRQNHSAGESFMNAGSWDCHAVNFRGFFLRIHRSGKESCCDAVMKIFPLGVTNC